MPIKIVKNQRVYFVFALNEMQQAAFERAKQNEILRTTMRMNLNDNLDNLCQQLAKHPKNQQIFRGPRWQSYGSADRSNEVR